MIVAHLSDLHLGFRAYGRVDRGVDVRERDVTAAFDRAVQEIVRLGPQVVVVAGDVFDRPDPPAGALVALARGLELLRSSLPGTPVLMVAGPRDTPRRPGDPGALAVLDTFPNVEAAAGLPRSILLERMQLHASLVPYRATVQEPVALPEPDPRARWNLLVLHASPGRVGQPGVFVDPADWSYVALGGEHRRRRLGPKVQYSGSLERVSLDPWEEAADEKGFLLVDLERGETVFHPVPGRAVAALAPIRVGPGDPGRLQRRVREVMGEVPGGIAGKIVRLRLEGIDPEDLLALQGDQLHRLRQQALHLAVEAGGESRVLTESWQPSDAPHQLREALTEELRRDGREGGATAELVRALVSEDPGGAVHGPIGVLEAVDGDVPAVGRVSTSVAPGLTGIIGGGGRSRRAVAGLLFDAPRVGEGPLARLWTGQGAETLDGALRQAVEAVAEARGLAIVRAALERAREMGGPEPGAGETPDIGPLRGAGAVRVDPKLVDAELRSAERELKTLREDAAEADGDLAAAAMDWHRERQDAETTLYTYRDRARELKVRIRQMESAGPAAPCPTCGRVLESRYDEVLSELREEWEGIVQDGSWWRRRWEQLEPKPAHLQELEGRSLRLHAALEATSERAELLRARRSELGETGRPGPAAASGGPLAEAVAALGRVHEARLARARDVLLTRASRYVGRVSGGRILAITWREGSAQLQGDAGPLTPLSEEDLAAGRMSLRLAAASLVAAGGRTLASLVVEEPFDRLDEEARLRTLVLLRSLLRDIPRIILVSRGEAADARPELFDAILEVRDDAGSGAAALRLALAGAGRVLLKEPALKERRWVPRT
jgi:Calcineurin-like phosphoesterase